MKKLVLTVVAAALLASCGGGSGPIVGGTSSGSPPPPPPASYNFTLLTNSPQMPSDGSKPATISALVRDANNNVVANVPVTFQASSGALTVTQGTTQANGTATATLATAGDPTDRDIKVTGTAGASTATVDVSVIGTKLSLSGPSNMVQGDTQPYTVSLVDSAGNGISGQSVDVTSAKDNTLNPSTFTTSTSGQGTFTVQAINSGTDTLTAAAAGLKAAQTVAVSNDSFTFTSPAANATVKIGTTETITIVWKSSGAPKVGQTVNFTATRGTLSAATATTAADGSASVTISSTRAGPSVISASASGVSAEVIVDFISTTPNSIALQAAPTTVPTQGQATVTATVRDAPPANNLVEGQTVNFALNDSTGGTLSAASAVTNAQGQASVTYTASSTTSATNGVVVTGTVQGTSITGSTSLTVAGQTVFLSLGTGNIIHAPNDTQYELPYGVQAVDSSGNGVDGVTVTFSVASLGYGKGVLVWNGTIWTPEGTGLFSTEPNFTTDHANGIASLIAGLDACNTEDPNNDGIEDDDYNNDFGAKQPGQPIIFPGQVVSTDVGSAVTANGGSAAVNLIYPKDHADWVAVRLTATATVQGSQSSTSVDFWLPGAAGDYNQSGTSPPGPVSPYGQANTCSDAN